MNNSDHFAFHSADVILLLELRKMEFPEGSGLPKTTGHKSGSAETEILESSFQIQRSQHPPQPSGGSPTPARLPGDTRAQGEKRKSKEKIKSNMIKTWRKMPKISGGGRDQRFFATNCFITEKRE